VERLGNHLKQRVPELCERYGKSPSQMPRISVDPIEKQHFILLPKYARQADINQLKLDVYRLQRTNPILAEKICIRLNALAMGQDLEVIDLLTDIRNVVRSNLVSAPAATDSTRSTTASATAETLSVGKVAKPEMPPAPQPGKQPKTSDELELNSEKGVDYRKLRDLLKAGDWKAADNETYEVMIRAVGKKSGDWFTTDELLNFSCADLLTIDRLWVHYSQGRFGFSVQKKIYIECGAKLDGKYPGDKIWRKFGDKVGWRKGAKWISYNSFTFSTSALEGHLPNVDII
ncbi:MAG: GUN4 domain-containing protein, partial [Leptolyngbya sp. SIO3F4]|nr:GUN4 domain-containing protein [Leptolyngbya sp. SIO3F4]